MKEKRSNSMINRVGRSRMTGMPQKTTEAAAQARPVSGMSKQPHVRQGYLLDMSNNQQIRY